MSDPNIKWTRIQHHVITMACKYMKRIHKFMAWNEILICEGSHCFLSHIKISMGINLGLEPSNLTLYLVAQVYILNEIHTRHDHTLSHDCIRNVYKDISSDTENAIVCLNAFIQNCGTCVLNLPHLIVYDSNCN